MDKIIICKHCGKPEYYGEMRWLSGRCSCRNCYKNQWQAENHGVFIRERLTIDVEGVSAEIDFGDIGKTVFLTESEAEAKLKELRGGEDESSN